MTFLNRLFLVLVNKKPKSKLKESEKLSDEELVAQIIKTNNTMLFSILYDRYGKKVYNKCLSFAKNETLAKDLTQDVFLKVFTKLATFKEKSKFSTWLYSLTYNFCVNYKTRDKGKKMEDASDSIENHDYYLNEVEDLDDIEDEELFEMRVDKLEKALENIDPNEKTLLLLKYQDDVSVKELQKLLEIGESAVKMRLKRARVNVIQAHNKI